MDSESAHLMELTPDPIQTTIIESKFNHQEKDSNGCSGHAGSLFTC
jgi:hypothetical protein